MVHSFSLCPELEQNGNLRYSSSCLGSIKSTNQKRNERTVRELVKKESLHQHTGAKLYCSYSMVGPLNKYLWSEGETFSFASNCQSSSEILVLTRVCTHRIMSEVNRHPTYIVRVRVKVRENQNGPQFYFYITFFTFILHWNALYLFTCLCFMCYMY